MAKGRVRIICGPGNGKSAAAVGYAVMGILHQKKVIMVQFLKGLLTEESVELLKRLEPEWKVFRFDRTVGRFEDLPEEAKQEELINLRNGFSFAKKVMVTGECDILVLDEILALVDQGVITNEEFESFLADRDEDIDLIMTGRVCPKGIEKYVDDIARVENIDVDNFRE